MRMLVQDTPLLDCPLKSLRCVHIFDSPFAQNGGDSLSVPMLYEISNTSHSVTHELDRFEAYSWSSATAALIAR